MARLYTGAAIDFLNANADKPFLLHIAGTMMHSVIDSWRELKDVELYDLEAAVSSIRRTVRTKVILSIGLASISVPGCIKMLSETALSP